MVLANEVTLLTSLLAIPLCIVLVRIVRRLSAVQSARLAKGDPPPQTTVELEAAPA